MDISQFVGENGLNLGCLTAVAIVWKTLRSDLDKCRSDHQSRQKQSENIIEKMGVLQGELNVLKAQGVNRLVSIQEMTQAFKAALADHPASKSKNKK
jgi:hypothetical protein